MWKVAIASLALVSNLVFAGPKVEFETTLGAFTIELNQEKAPVTVDNFLKYVKDGSYVGPSFTELFRALWHKVVVLIKT